MEKPKEVKVLTKTISLERMMRILRKAKIFIEEPFILSMKVSLKYERVIITYITEEEDSQIEQKSDEELAEIFKIPIKNLDISEGLQNALREIDHPVRGQVETIGDLHRLGGTTLAKTRNLGETRKNELRYVLKQLGVIIKGL